jgi:hypothetical protein
VASDNHTTAAGLFFRINTVFNAKSSLFDSVVENCCILVVTYTANVNDGIRWEDVLGPSSCVLGSTARNELCIVVIQKVFVEVKVFFFGEDRIVGLEAIFLKQLCVADTLNI